jgi:glutaredoxin
MTPEIIVFTDPANCPPCQKLESELQSVQAELKELKVTKFLPEQGIHWQIESVPTIIVVEKGSQGWIEKRRNKGFLDRVNLFRFIRGN